MYQEFYANSDLMILPVIGLCMFFVSFVLVLAWVVFGLRKSSMPAEMAQLPLHDDVVEECAKEERSHE